MKLAVLEASGTRSYLDLSKPPLPLMEFSQDLHIKSPRLFRIKASFNIYCMLSIDQAFSESEYLFH